MFCGNGAYSTRCLVDASVRVPRLRGSPPEASAPGLTARSVPNPLAEASLQLPSEDGTLTQIIPRHQVRSSFHPANTKVTCHFSRQRKNGQVDWFCYELLFVCLPHSGHALRNPHFGRTVCQRRSRARRIWLSRVSMLSQSLNWARARFRFCESYCVLKYTSPSR